MPLGTKVNGSWRSIGKVFANVGGQYRSIQKIYANVGGVWRNVWSYFTAVQAIVSGDRSSTQLVNKAYVQLWAEDSQLRGADAGMVLDQEVDLTNVSSVSVDWEINGNTDNESAAYLIVSKIKFGGLGTYDKFYYYGPRGSRRSSVNVSSLSGKYYIRVHSGVNPNSSLGARQKNVAVYRIYLDDTKYWDASSDGAYGS